MKKIKLTLILTSLTGALVACGGGGGTSGIASLGSDFVRAFSQAPNDTPLDPTQLALVLTPTVEPFDP